MNPQIIRKLWIVRKYVEQNKNTQKSYLANKNNYFKR